MRHIFIFSYFLSSSSCHSGQDQGPQDCRGSELRSVPFQKACSDVNLTGEDLLVIFNEPTKPDSFLGSRTQGPIHASYQKPLEWRPLQDGESSCHRSINIVHFSADDYPAHCIGANDLKGALSRSYCSYNNGSSYVELYGRQSYSSIPVGRTPGFIFASTPSSGCYNGEQPPDESGLPQMLPPRTSFLWSHDFGKTWSWDVENLCFERQTELRQHPGAAYRVYAVFKSEHQIKSSNMKVTIPGPTGHENVDIPYIIMPPGYMQDGKAFGQHTKVAVYWHYWATELEKNRSTNRLTLSEIGTKDLRDLPFPENGIRDVLWADLDRVIVWHDAPPHGDGQIGELNVKDGFWHNIELPEPVGDAWAVDVENLYFVGRRFYRWSRTSRSWEVLPSPVAQQ